MCELVAQVLRGDGVLDECVGEGFWVCGGRVKDGGCRCECFERDGAIWCETGLELLEEESVVGMVVDLPFVSSARVSMEASYLV